MSAFYFMPTEVDTFFPVRRVPRQRPQRTMDAFAPFMTRSQAFHRPRPVVYARDHHDEHPDMTWRGCACHGYPRYVPSQHPAAVPEYFIHPRVAEYGHHDDDTEYTCYEAPRARYGPAPSYRVPRQPVSVLKKAPKENVSNKANKDENADALLSKLLTVLLGHVDTTSKLNQLAKTETWVATAKREASEINDKVAVREESGKRSKQSRRLSSRTLTKPKEKREQRQHLPLPVTPPFESKDETCSFRIPNMQLAKTTFPVKKSSVSSQSLAEESATTHVQENTAIVERKLQRIRQLKATLDQLASPASLGTTLHRPLTFNADFKHVSLVSRSFLELRERLYAVLKQLDEIESVGEEAVRRYRKQVIGQVMKALDVLDQYESAERERQSEASSSGSLTETEVASEGEVEQNPKKVDPFHWSEAYEGVGELFAAA